MEVVAPALFGYVLRNDMPKSPLLVLSFSRNDANPIIVRPRTRSVDERVNLSNSGRFKPEDTDVTGQDDCPGEFK